MVTIDLFQSLSMVKNEIDITLGQAQTRVQDFVDDPENIEALTLSTDLMTQLMGVFKLMGFAEVVILLQHLREATMSVGSAVQSEQMQGVDDQLVAIGKGMLVLQRYIDRIIEHQQILPALLIPTINGLLAVLKQPELPDNFFFKGEVTLESREQASLPEAALDELEKSASRMRQMLQVGLLGVMRDGQHAHLSFIGRALTRIDRLSGHCPMGLLWWVARAAVEALLKDEMPLGKSQIVLLGKLDRQVKRLVYDGLDILQEVPPEMLVKECLYLVSQSTQTEGVIAQVRAACLDHADTVSAQALQAGISQLLGPGVPVMQAVAKNIKEEMSSIEDQLDMFARGVEVEAGFFAKLSEDFARLAKILLVLQLDHAGKILAEQSALVAEWSLEERDSAHESYQAAAHALLVTDNAIEAMLAGKTFTGPMTLETMSTSLLDQARDIVIAEARSGLATAKRSVSAYVETHWDQIHLKNVPITMSAVSGGLYFLDQPRALQVVKACDRYLQKLIAEANERQPNEHDLATLADAMTSIDYFLEGIEAQKSVGGGVLDLAEESMKELGVDFSNHRVA